jgi:hypothetical protein
MAKFSYTFSGIPISVDISATELTIKEAFRTEKISRQQIKMIGIGFLPIQLPKAILNPPAILFFLRFIYSRYRDLYKLRELEGGVKKIKSIRRKEDFNQLSTAMVQVFIQYNSSNKAKLKTKILTINPRQAPTIKMLQYFREKFPKKYIGIGPLRQIEETFKTKQTFTRAISYVLLGIFLLVSMYIVIFHYVARIRYSHSHLPDFLEKLF